ncbi:splicing factor [Yamadazyma tenuis]|uniref:splicing factor n=1 Tax=Candida tenuis TaxID=2315449 RepID=UPI0027A50BE4|nr:splicing factor [Yamadazyma tenuis]
MAAEQRKLLVQLMGNDSLISPVVRRRMPEITSHKVCKSFLVGTCPYDLFVGTKQDLGRCPKLHLEKLKLEYEYRTKKGELFPDFRYEYYMTLRRYVQDIDYTIENANKKLEHTPEEKEKISEVTKDLENLDTKIGLMQQEINYLIAENKTQMVLNQSIKLSALIEERQKLGEKARTIIENIGQSAQQKLQVCEQCGAFLSRLDSDRRTSTAV